MSAKFNTEFNVWSILTTLVTTAVTITMAWVWLQSDVKALQTKDAAIEVRMDRLETSMTRRADAADERARIDREALLRMEGDIRVVRQILEGMRAQPERPR